jgi:hypothetical protein
MGGLANIGLYLVSKPAILISVKIVLIIDLKFDQRYPYQPLNELFGKG